MAFLQESTLTSLFSPSRCQGEGSMARTAIIIQRVKEKQAKTLQ
jgi:hypothetical protein